MKAIVLIAGLGLLGVIASGCGGPVAPLSAQAGSSIVIPVTGDLLSDTTIGFGGDITVDHQRGSLVFRLREADIELRTRMTSAITTTSMVDFTLVGAADKRQVVSLVDIPAETPAGSYHIDVSRRFRDLEGIEREESIPYGGEIMVLPHELDLDCDQTPDVTGAPTPWVAFLPTDLGTVFPLPVSPTSTGDVGPIPDLMPLPELVLSFEPHASALELDVTYPADKIRIEGVMDGSRGKLSRGIVWSEPHAPNGQVSIGRIGLSGNSIAIAFRPRTAEPLDPAQVSVTIRSATDSAGFDVPTVVSSMSIR